MNVALIGYFGHNNLGDEAILQSIISQLKKYHKPVQPIVFTHAIEATRMKFGVTALRRKSLPHLIAGISMSDIVIFAGGSLFQDTTSLASLFYYTGLILLARFFNKKVVLYAQGIEPLRYRLSRIIIRNTFLFSHYISVRDKESIRYLKEIIKIKKPIYYTADSALLIFPLIKHTPFKHYIGLNLMNITELPLEQIGEDLKRFSDYSHRKYLFIPFHENDLLAIKPIMSILGEDRLTVLEGDYSIPELMGLIGQLDLMIGTRLHSLIFSATAYTPFVGIHVHDKVESFSREVKQRYLSVSNLQNGQLYSNLKEVFDKKGSYRNQIKFLVEELNKRSRNNTINDIITRYDKI